MNGDYRAWRDGLVCPAAITAALDLRQLYGPEVDEACGAAEPAVDEWEAGQRYPSWEQLEALAVLTGFPVRFFTRPYTAGAVTGYLCKRGGRGRGCQRIDTQPGPLEFPSAVVAATAGTRWHTPEVGSANETGQCDESSQPGLW